MVGKYLIVHCSYTTKRQQIGVSDIRRWHLNRGWKDIGYHFVIDRMGETHRGREFGELGAHAYGHNENTGVCLVGGKSEDDKPENNFNVNQFRSLEILYYKLKYFIPKLIIAGHKDFDKSRECPCFDIENWAKINSIPHISHV